MPVKVYERILDLFEAEGISTIFGIPDPNFVHLFHLADERGWTVVAPRHEEAAGFMAEAVSRMTGQAAVCIGTLGPGLANLAGGDDRQDPGVRRVTYRVDLLADLLDRP